MLLVGKEAAHFDDRNREWVFSGWYFSFWFLLGYTFIQKDLTEISFTLFFKIIIA